MFGQPGNFLIHRVAPGIFPALDFFRQKVDQQVREGAGLGADLVVVMGGVTPGIGPDIVIMPRMFIKTDQRRRRINIQIKK